MQIGIMNITGSSAIAEIFEKYKNRMYRLALSIARNEKDAEDIVQNAFIKIIKNIKRFRHQSSLSTWIYRITYNEALMQLRKRRNQVGISDTLVLDRRMAQADLFINWPKLPDRDLLDDEFKERMDNAIKQMPIRYRMPILLHNVEGLVLKDASLVLGLNLNSFKTRLHRAYMALRTEISDYFRDKKSREISEDPRCGAWTGFAYNYINNTLNRKTQVAFRRHIDDCPDCKSFLDTYIRAVRSITNALECKDIPPQLQTKIESFLARSNVTKRA